MKFSFAATVLFATASLCAYLPSCSWNDCIGGWNGANCASGNGWSCLCSNATAIAQINTCVATSCTNTTDQEAVYGAIAQLCANNGVTVTAAPEATFSATSGGSILATITPGPGYPGWGTGAWSSWVSACSTALPGAPSGWSGGAWGSHSGWGGPGGWGGGGGGGGGGNGGGGWGGPGGPWGTKASGVNCDAWTTWTAGWGPFSSWTGTWSGCSATTASPLPATVTTTMTTSGSTQVVTGTTFGVQAVEASAASTTASASPSGSGAVPIGGSVHAYAALAIAVFATMVIL